MLKFKNSKKIKAKQKKKVLYYSDDIIMKLWITNLLFSSCKSWNLSNKKRKKCVIFMTLHSGTKLFLYENALPYYWLKALCTLFIQVTILLNSYSICALFLMCKYPSVHLSHGQISHGQISFCANIRGLLSDVQFALAQISGHRGGARVNLEKIAKNHIFWPKNCILISWMTKNSEKFHISSYISHFWFIFQ